VSGAGGLCSQQPGFVPEEAAKDDRCVAEKCIVSECCVKEQSNCQSTLSTVVCAKANGSFVDRLTGNVAKHPCATPACTVAECCDPIW
jgi:hypothetical protein